MGLHFLFLILLQKPPNYSLVNCVDRLGIRAPGTLFTLVQENAVNQITVNILIILPLFLLLIDYVNIWGLAKIPNLLIRCLDNPVSLFKVFFAWLCHDFSPEVTTQ